MKTKLTLFSLLISSLLLSTCTGEHSVFEKATFSPTKPVGEQAPTLTADFLPTPLVDPSATFAPTGQVDVIPSSVSFELDPLLGSGFDTMSIAENRSAEQGYYEIHPEYTEITLKDYPLTGSTLPARIYLFPVLRYRELSPDVMPIREADLQSLISGSISGSQELPLLPIFNSDQIFTGKESLIEFQNGKGIRFITQYSQGIVPINNHEMFYTFQGLTDDNKYWVSVILPISSPILPADGKNPPNGISMQDIANNYKAYIVDTTAQLNAQTLGSFSPSILVLDTFVQSIVVQP